MWQSEQARRRRPGLESRRPTSEEPGRTVPVATGPQTYSDVI